MTVPVLPLWSVALNVQVPAVVNVLVLLWNSLSIVTLETVEGVNLVTTSPETGGVYENLIESPTLSVSDVGL